MPLAVYIDDEAPLCEVYAMLLRDAGIAVRTFTDPELALEFIAAHDVAVVVCDYRMPKMSGLDLAAQIPDGIPFFLTSGDPELVRKCNGHPRITGVLSKPIDPEELIELMRRQLQRVPGPDNRA